MVQAFKFTFKVLKNTKGFFVSMVIMPIFLVMLVSITFAYSDIPVVGYVGEKAPKVSNIKMIKLQEEEKDYFLGLSQGTLVIETDSQGEVKSYYSSVENNPLIPYIEYSDRTDTVFTEKPKVRYSMGVILFKLMTAASLLSTVLIQEKENGIILRLKNSKTKLSSYIFGKALAIVFIYEVANMIILGFYKIMGFDFGNSTILNLAIVFTIMLFVSSGIYIFVAGLLKDEGNVWGISTGILFPLGVCSGIMFPIEYVPKWMDAIAHVSPIYYLQKAVENGKIEIMPVFIMLAVSVVFAFVGIYLMKRRQ